MTDAVWSPGLKKNIGYVWVPIGLAEPGNRLDVETEDGDHLVGHDRRDPVRRPAQGEARRVARLVSRIAGHTRSGDISPHLSVRPAEPPTVGVANHDV